MVSLWGNKKNGEDQQQDNGESSDNMPRTSEEHREPTERDSLLPREHGRPRQDGFLDPDDPAVGCE